MPENGGTICCERTWNRPVLMILALPLSPLLGCADEAGLNETAHTAQAVVYGSDDRLEVFEERSEVIATIARRSVAALILNRRLHRQPDGRYWVDAPTAAMRHELCSTERYADQPAAAECSATLISEDAVLTAGHCVRSSEQCESYAIVFNYWYARPGVLTEISDESVFRCKRIVYSETVLEGNDQRDFAVVQLDRKALSFMPAAVGVESGVALGTPVVLVGAAAGGPVKTDHGGTVSRYVGQPSFGFLANVDAFVGSSGSGVFTEEGVLIGVFSSGRGDYATDSGCAASRHFENEVGSEKSFWAGLAIAKLCALGERSSAKCAQETEQNAPSQSNSQPVSGGGGAENSDEKANEGDAGSTDSDAVDAEVKGVQACCSAEHNQDACSVTSLAGGHCRCRRVLSLLIALVLGACLRRRRNG